MKMTYTTRNGRMTVEIEGDTHVAIVQQLSSFSEVFEEDTCKKCKSDNVRWVIRRSKDGKGKTFDYHELRCNACGAKLAYGVLDDQTFRLFPKRKDKDGKIKGKYGWTKWNPETEKEE